VRGAGRIKKALGTARRWFRPGAVVLMYHRVADISPDTYGLTVSSEHFAEQMDVLRRSYLPMPLTGLISALRAGKLPRRAVAVTFDDGYHDNYCVAYPLLQMVDVPATVFVISGHVGSLSEFWWDDLERMLLLPERLPPGLSLDLDGRRHYWRTETPGDRVQAHGALYSLILQETAETRRMVLDSLLAWSGVDARGRPTHRAMTESELLQLVDGDLVDIGGHTITHPVLSRLSLGKQHLEISEGCRRLSEVIGRPVQSFAYPFGQPGDWTSATAGLVQALGLCGAVTTIPGSIERGADPYRLRRWAVSDCGGDQFARALASFFVL